MIVVSDTTAITTLIKAGDLDFLRMLFGEVLVPQSVRDELLAFHPSLPDFVRLHPVAGSLPPSTGMIALGRGEREAMLLAQELHADLLLTDDRKARRAATALGLNVAGLLGLVVHAKINGRIPSAKKFIRRLEQDGGLYLSESLVAEALAAAGELP